MICIDSKDSKDSKICIKKIQIVLYALKTWVIASEFEIMTGIFRLTPQPVSSSCTRC
jgi:hypothetical protein